MAMLAATQNMFLRPKTISCSSSSVHTLHPISWIRLPINAISEIKMLDRKKFKMPLQALVTGNRGGVLVHKVTARQLYRILIKDRTMPLILEFYAAWCGSSITMAQEVELLAVEYARRVRFFKVDTDEEYELAQQMQIRGLPTLVYISPDPNEPAVRIEGILSRSAVRKVINARLKIPEDVSEDPLMDL